MSLHSKIRVIFLVATLLLSAFFITFFFFQKSVYIKDSRKRYMQSVLYIHKYLKFNRANGTIANLEDSDLQLFLQESSLEIVKEDILEKILQSAKKIDKKRVFRSRVWILKYGGEFYLLIKSHRVKILLKDRQKSYFLYKNILGYTVSILFLALLYFWIINSLKPLKVLQKKIREVGGGNLNIDFKSSRVDEVADISNAFDKSLEHIRSLIDSRQLFLRTIMHELKTPIAKGRLLNEFLKDVEQRGRYDSIFERLEILIEEFAKIEKMFSSNYEIKLGLYNIEDILFHALELMFVDEVWIQQRVKIIKKDHILIESDFELFALALKNLLDNAIKYSTDHKVEVYIEAEFIEIVSSGDRLQGEFQEYIKPFNQKSQSSGLGLYIVDNIARMLGLDFSYRFSSNKNIFTISY
jgi:two-component system OmpR family sensor kinase